MSRSFEWIDPAFCYTNDHGAKVDHVGDWATSAKGQQKRTCTLCHRVSWRADPDDPTGLPYPDVPWLSAERLVALIEQVEEMGADEVSYFEGDGFDWDDFIKHLESDDEPYPTQWDHKLMTKIQRLARKARKEANG